MSRVESPFAELSIGGHFENVISVVSSPEAPPLLGGYDNHRKQAGNRPLHAVPPPSGHPPTCPARESERALAFVNCLRLNGIVFDQIHMLTGRDLCNSLHTIFTFLSLLGGQNQASNLQSSHHGRRDSDFSRSIRACRNTPYDKRGTPLSVVGLARTVNTLHQPTEGSQSGDYCRRGLGKLLLRIKVVRASVCASSVHAFGT